MPGIDLPWDRNEACYHGPPARRPPGDKDALVKPIGFRLSLCWIARLALAAQISCACAAPALAQAQTGRGAARVFFGGEAIGQRATVESASREAQAAIRACEDRAALVCVADALSRYADALHQIAEERRHRMHASSYKTP
jgi:hypothetical protein